MSKKRKKTAEFRYYRIPDNQTMMALLGEKWRQTYGRDIDYLHFHNYLEIGYCYEGRGTIVLGEDEYPFRGGGEFTAIPRNYLHTTNSELGNVSYWEYLFVDVEKLLKKWFPDRQDIWRISVTRLISVPFSCDGRKHRSCRTVSGKF